MTETRTRAVGGRTTSQGWVRTWAASPQSSDMSFNSLQDYRPLAQVTLRQEVRVSGGGHQVRILFTNEYGISELHIGGARVGLAQDAGGVLPGSDRVLTFGGSHSTMVPAGAAMLSDPVEFPVKAMATLSISVYLPERVTNCTCHDPSLNNAWCIPGDVLAETTLTTTAEPLPVLALLSAVEVLPEAPGGTIVAFGDSRVDGAGSTPGASRTWPDLLAERLLARGGSAVYVCNQGISGNRMLNGGLGASGLARYDRDVLATPGLRYVLMSIGGNDLTISAAKQNAEGPMAEFLQMFPGEPVSTDDVIAGYTQMIAQAHQIGVKIYAATIPPFEGDDIYTPEGDRAREVVNTWIRTSQAFDAVLDFDAVWRDPAHPSQILEGLHAGDYLHGSDAGYQALADSIDLSLFE